MELIIGLSLKEMQNMIGKLITVNPKIQAFENGVLEIWSQEYLVESFEIISDDVICNCTKSDCYYHYSVKDFIFKIINNENEGKNE